MDKRRHSKFPLLHAFIMLGAAALLSGCASISIESARDPGFAGKINRLYVVIRDNGQLKKSYSQNLQKAMTERLLARGIASQVQVISPLELDESKYAGDIKSFSPDAVLVIQTTGGSRRLQEIIEVYWDASLRVPGSKMRIWRATLHMSGGSSLSRMTAMVDGILSKMEQDGIIAPAAKAGNNQESAVPSESPGKTEGSEGK